ncbi:hypothetical protein EZV62_010806 [Acer yangbiense]|uniref:Uncharacterized protein n=1 Tax=Acer yangbiense TaxID=1000413 RepID=A0A5C7I5K8_9ROSI|nr:hypothetical protein EZV62_010806 [Acer yangbiense]
MGSTDLARLCENLSIKDEDNEIHQIAKDVGRVGVEEVEHCLVGKVLAGKRVNREAFRAVIEQLWCPFSNVEIEVVGENIFMFYFNNPEDRDRIWQRGPWHFDRSLIVLVKPEGTGDIAQLSFNKAEFWVQIHDIPLMCMNKRTVKWLAEQIGTVIEIPMESRECWGRFMRVKTSRFLLRCGRVGHGINECVDVEAKKEALEGTTTKYGSWLKAATVEKVKLKSHSQGSGGSSVKKRSSDDLRETVNIGTFVREKLLPGNRNGGPESSTMVASREAVENHPEDSSFEERAGKESLDRMCVDGPFNGLAGEVEKEAQGSKGSVSGGQSKLLELSPIGPLDPMREEQQESPRDPSDVQELDQDSKSETQPGLKVKRKKWKRAAREVQRKPKSDLLASPLQQKLMVSLPSMKTPIRNSNSPTQHKLSPKTSSEKRKAGSSFNPQPSPQGHSNMSGQEWEKRQKGSSKRKVNFKACGAGPPRAMIGLCWNVRGLGNPCTVAALKKLVKKHSPDLIFLSETKMERNRAEKIREALGYKGGFGVDSIGSSGGLLLLWNEDCNVSVQSFSVGHIDVRIQVRDGPWWKFSGMYGEPNPNKRPNFWNLIRRLREVDWLPWMCAGDFNELLSISEKSGGSKKTIRDIIKFRQVVEDCDLIDLGFSGPMFTWNNKREGKDNV